MNTLLKILPALALTATISLTHAQTPVAKEEGQMPMKNKKMHSMGPMQDCVMMQDGKMMQMKDGKTMAMTSDMTMNNGTKVMTNGQVMMADGKSMTLTNGQRVLMDGTVRGGGKMKGKMSGSM